MGLINTEKLQRFYNTLKTHAFEVTSPDTTGEVTFNNTDNLSEIADSLFESNQEVLCIKVYYQKNVQSI